MPLVSVFEFDESRTSGLSVLQFDDASREWLGFVGDNRKGKAESGAFDIVAGPVANDNTMPVLRLFFAGIYTEDETIRRLLPQNLKDQYAFKSEAALAALRFCEVKAV